MNGVVPTFLTELCQLLFSCLLLEDLKSAVMVSKRWQDTGEVLKLWEGKKVATWLMHALVSQVQSRMENSLE